MVGLSTVERDGHQLLRGCGISDMEEKGRVEENGDDEGFENYQRRDEPALLYRERRVAAPVCVVVWRCEGRES